MSINHYLFAIHRGVMDGICVAVGMVGFGAICFLLVPKILHKLRMKRRMKNIETPQARARRENLEWKANREKDDSQSK